MNYVGTEYNDAGCTDPTGNTVVISGGDGECAQDLAGSANTMAECRADGTIVVQQFLLEDETCSGDVIYQTTIPTQSLASSCTAGTAGGLYYG